MIQFLRDNKIVYGVEQQVVKLLLKRLPVESFPYTIARGKPAKRGEDGEIKPVLHFNTVVEPSPDWNFRDVMRIPSVEKGQKLAKVSPAGTGTEGMNVYGGNLKAIPNNPATKMAGENVVFREADQSFYAISEGQLSSGERHIHVHPVYEIDHSLTLKEGNLDFVGSIIIHGDVPSGYTVQARGDIKIYGMVEASTLIAGGAYTFQEGYPGRKREKSRQLKTLILAILIRVKFRQEMICSSNIR